MPRSFTSSTGNTLYKKDLITKKAVAKKNQINGIYLQIEKLILSIDKSFSKAIIKKFVETYKDEILKISRFNLDVTYQKNKIYEIGKLWLKHHGLDIPDEWRSQSKSLARVKAPKNQTPIVKNTKPKNKYLNKKEIKKLHKQINKELQKDSESSEKRKSVWVPMLQGGAPGLGKK